MLKKSGDNVLVSVSILSCNNKEAAVRNLNFSSADYLHIDFMDGKFTKNKSMKVKEIREISKYSVKKLDVHLMVTKPKKYIKKLAEVNASYMTFHIEASGKKTREYLNLIKSYGIKAGLAISPNTSIDTLEDYINDVDIILLMSVYPGAGGQEFLKESPERLQEIKQLCHNHNVSPIISIDGGINDKTMNLVKDVDMIVAGSYVSKSKEYEQNILSIKNLS